MPMSRSAWSTLTTAMIQSGTLREFRSPMSSPLRRPAPLGAAGDVVQRAPAFVGRGPRLLDRAANVRQFTNEIVELRLDLGADAPAALRQIQPTPYPAGDCPQHRCQQYTRSFFHAALDHVLELAHVAGPAMPYEDVIRRRGDRLHVALVTGLVLLEEMLAEERNVLGALPQGRHPQRDRIDAEIEVFAQLAVAQRR